MVEGFHCHSLSFPASCTVETIVWELNSRKALKKYVRPSQNISPGSLEPNFLITSHGILIEVTTRIGYGWINIPAGPNMNQGNSHCFGSRCGEGNMQTWNIEPCWSFVFLLPLMYLNEYWMRSDALCSCFPKVSAHSIWFFTGVSSDFPPLLLPPVF